jgi:hypothetical protein
VINLLLTHALPRSLVEQGLRDVFGDPSRVTPEMVDRAIAINQREGNRRALVDRFRQRQAGSFAHRIPELKLSYRLGWTRPSDLARRRRTLLPRHRRQRACDF